MERTKRRSRLLTCAIVWTVLLMLWTMASISPNAMAYIRGGYTYGSNTWVQDSTPKTNANIGGVALPSVLNIDDEGETVYYELSYMYDDRRTSGPTAQHTFTISVYYPGRLPYAKQVNKYTDYGEGPFGPYTLTLDVPDCQITDTVTINFLVSVSIPGETPADDSSGPLDQTFY